MKLPVERVSVLKYVESLLRKNNTNRIDFSDTENITLIHISPSVIIHVKTEEFLKLNKTNLTCYESYDLII